MIIKKTRIQNVDFAKEFITNGKLYIGVPADEVNAAKLGIDLSLGETSVIPAPGFGKNCDRNVNGEWITEKSGAKELRHVNTVKWTWRDWAGNEYSDWRNVAKECYPKSFINPYLIEINLVKNSDRNYLASIIEIIDFEHQEKIIKQTINMFLEIFGYCILYDAEFIIDFNNIKRCQWELLPPDEKIFVISQWLKTHKDKKENIDAFFQFRLDTIISFSPNETYVGEKGMTGYFAFVFDNFCIFENGKSGNATYITGAENWQELSQMTKKELFDSGNILARFIHQRQWYDQIKQFVYQNN